MYKYIDDNIEEIKRKIKAYFQNARLGLLKYDELNKSDVEKNVDDVFNRVQDLNDKLLEGIVEDMRLDKADYPVSMLNDRYNSTTKYVFANEILRKRDRYKENILSSIYGATADFKGQRNDFNRQAVVGALSTIAFIKLQEKNARILSQQIEESAVDNERYMYLDNGLKEGFEYVRWVTAEDERVCGECNGYHNQIFAINEVPERPHLGCRCELELVSEEELKELGENYDT